MPPVNALLLSFPFLVFTVGSLVVTPILEAWRVAGLQVQRAFMLLVPTETKVGSLPDTENARVSKARV
jgi:hypothetical protein